MSLNKVRFKNLYRESYFCCFFKIRIYFHLEEKSVTKYLNIFDKKTKPSGQVHAILTIMFHKQ